MKTAIRLDDITPDMDYSKFNKLKQILDTYQIKPLIGVVPFNEDSNLRRSENNPDFADMIRNLEKEGYVIALHGYHHVYTTKKGGLFPLNHFSEYAGVPYERQLQMIQEGKKAILDMSISTSIFMAPAHSYDTNTLKALKKCGFTAITDGFGKRPYRRKGLTFYPIAMKRQDCFKDKAGYTTLVIHANSIEEDEFKQYQKMIMDNKSHFISYQEYLQVDSVSRTILGNLMEYILACTKYILVKIKNR